MVGQYIHGLENCIDGSSSFDVTAKAKLCFEQFLFSNMNYTGASVLLEDWCSMHLVDLPGPFVLQVQVSGRSMINREASENKRLSKVRKKNE